MDEPGLRRASTIERGADPRGRHRRPNASPFIAMEFLACIALQLPRRSFLASSGRAPLRARGAEDRTAPRDHLLTYHLGRWREGHRRHAARRLKDSSNTWRRSFASTIPPRRHLLRGRLARRSQAAPLPQKGDNKLEMLTQNRLPASSTTSRRTRPPLSRGHLHARWLCDRANRYATADEMADRLESWLREDQQVSARATSARTSRRCSPLDARRSRPRWRRSLALRRLAGLAQQG